MLKKHSCPIFLVLCITALPGGACQRSPQPSDPPAAAAPETHEDPLVPEDADAPSPAEEEDRVGYQPVSMGDRISIEPAEPVAGQPVEVRAGPLTFRNGCEGIERSWAEEPDADGRIVLRWAPRHVPPDAMCTMALHSQWIEAVIEDLEPGEYVVVAPGIGEQSLTVRPE